MNEAEFWDNMEETEDGCWEWQRCRNRQGYGMVWFEGDRWLTHRLAWTLSNGETPDGLCVLHHCDNPPCCNPDHLFIGTQADNMRDMVEKDRQSRGEARPTAVLGEAQVIKMRKLYAANGFTQQELANTFGISQSQVSRILIGEKWADASGPLADPKQITVLDQGQVMKIRKLYATGGFFQKELGEMFGISQVQVSAIVSGKSWPNTPGPIKGKDYEVEA